MPAKRKLKFEVLVAQWNGFSGGVQEVEADEELVRHVIAAESAEAVRIVSLEGARPKDVVEADSASVKAQAQAMKTGDWHHGHLQQVILDERANLLQLDQIEDPDEERVAEARARSEATLAEAESRLKELRA